MTPLVRRARPGDLAAVGALTVAAYAPFTRGPDDPYVARLADAAARDRDAELWVAAHGDEVVGTVTTCPPGSPWREIAGDGEAEFRMLAVDPAAHGRGTGRRLVAHVVDRARRAGDRRVVLSTTPGMAAAHRLYERLGFVRVPARDWAPLPDVPLLAYVLDLSDDPRETA